MAHWQSHGHGLGGAASSVRTFERHKYRSLALSAEYRYVFSQYKKLTDNVVTFSYTSAFWKWEDWELELDWLAMRGVNLPLAWVGYEKILIDVFHEAGFTDADIHDFLSGPAFQAWNRFGNIQGDWIGELPFDWVDSQFELQKKILPRMLELGMTPVLPSFAGYVPRAVSHVLPDAEVVNATNWGAMPDKYSNDSFIQPFDPHFARMQKSFLTKQLEAYGNVTHIYTLDQYNEMTPYSGDLNFLRNVSKTTMNIFKYVDPESTWLMQGWLFYADQEFWTDDRIEAYLSAGEDFQDMLILDLHAESNPIWKQTKSFYGKAWIWCQVHGLGGNMNFFGMLPNITAGPIEALENSPSLVGVGNANEGQDDEIMFNVLLDQGWSQTELDTEKYFRDFVTARYSGGRAGEQKIPNDIYKAWEIMRTNIYNYSHSTVGIPTFEDVLLTMVPKSPIGQSPSLELKNELRYDPKEMVKAWALLLKGGLFDDSAYRFDLVQFTRQVLEDAFSTTLPSLQSKYKKGAPASDFMPIARKILLIIKSMDSVLMTEKSLRLSEWISAARAWGGSNEALADYFEQNARSQVTHWAPSEGPLNDYAQKSWGGLVSGYYYPRWSMFVDYLESTPTEEYNETELRGKLWPMEYEWIKQTSDGDDATTAGDDGDLRSTLEDLKRELGDIFVVG